MVAAILKGFEPYKWLTQFGFAAIMAVMLLRMVDGYMGRQADAMRDFSASLLVIQRSEERQTEWQTKWTAEIESEHAKRAAEAREIARELSDRHSEERKLYQKQLEVLEALCNKLVDDKKDGGT